MKRRMVLENWKLYSIIGVIIVMIIAIITMPILVNTKKVKFDVCFISEEGYKGILRVLIAE